MTEKLLSKEPHVQSYELVDSDDKTYNDRSFPIGHSSQYQILPRGAKERSEVFDVLFDIALIGVPLLLLCKTALCMWCYYHDEGNRGTEVDQASKVTKLMIQFNGQLVTLFTIIFVSIMATLMKRYALYKAQKGAYLVQLEQLQSSVSLPSTFKMIWKLRAWSMLSVMLVFIWTFYYIGSQASEREFSLEDSDRARDIQSAVIDFDAPIDFSPNDPKNATELANINQIFTDQINPIYNGAAREIFSDWKMAYQQNSTIIRGTMLGPLVPNLQFETHPTNVTFDQNVGTDMFSGMIPTGGKRFEPLKPRLNSNWYDVSVQSKNLYTSFIGRQLSLLDGYDAEVNWTKYTTAPVIGKYTFKTGYFFVECGAPAIMPWDAFPNGTWANSSISLNKTKITVDTPRNQRNETLGQFDFWYRSMYLRNYPCFGDIVLKSTCSITTTYVDVQARCKSNGCFSHEMQYRNGDTKDNAISWFTPFRNDDFASIFFSNIINSTGRPISGYEDYDKTHFALYTGVDTYDRFFPSMINYNDDYINCTFNSTAWQSGSQLIAQTISHRLAILFTSYYEVIQLYQSNSASGSFMGPSDALYPYPDLTMKQQIQKYYSFVNFEGNFYRPGYYLFWEWIALDIVSCLILFVAGILCYVLRQRTLAPDILGYVSSLTRDNPHLDLPEVATTYDGIERANLFKNVKIKIGDVYSQDHVNSKERAYGKVGVSRAGVEGLWVGDLRPERKYV